MSIQSLMIHTCDIDSQASGITKTASGAHVKGWTRRATNVPCRVHDDKPDEAKMADSKFDVTKSKRIYMDKDYGIVPARDRIVWGGVAYQVYSVGNAGGNLNRLWQIDVERVPS